MNRRTLLKRAGVGSLATAIVATVAVAAIRAEGFRSDHVTLHDNSVWVSNNRGQVGRFNYDLQLVDTKSATFDPIRDVFQRDASVVVETQSGKMFSYNVAMNASDGEGNLPDSAVISLGGDNGILLDRSSSKAWFVDRTGLASIVVEGAQETPGSLELQGADTVVVGTDGVAHVLDVDGKRVWTFEQPFTSFSTAVAQSTAPTTALIPDAGPETTVALIDQIPADVLDGLVLNADLEDDYQITTAGSSLVILSGRDLILADGSSLPLPADVGDDPRLQESSAAESAVLVASELGLVSVDLKSGVATAIASEGSAGPIRPIAVGSCVYAAWSASVFSSCSNPTTYESPSPIGQESRFRTNRNRVVLNFVDGSLIAFPQSEQMQVIDNEWSDALDPNEQDDETETAESEAPEERENACEIPARNSAPVVPTGLVFSVRAGQSSLLDVLNPPGGTPASDPDCDVLTVYPDPNTPLDPAIGVVSRVSDGRALQFQPSGAAGGTAEVAYVVSDGSADGVVGATALVQIIGADDPGTSPNANADSTSVEVGQTVVIDVLANDVDAEGDALTVRQATLAEGGAGALVWQPGGRFAYTAPGAGVGTQTVEYVLEDDHGLQDVGTLEINVISAGVKAPPNPRSDAALAMWNAAAVDSQINLNLLLNDSDPNGDALRVVGIEAYPSGSAPEPRLADDGTITVTPTGPGSFNYMYTVADPDGQEARSRVHIEVLPDQGRVAPVAVRDSVVVSTVRPTVIDVLRNDTDLNGDVLMVTDIAVPDAAAEEINVEVLDSHYLRISTRKSQPAGDAYTFTYTISDGEQQSTASVAISVVPSGGTQPPVALEDRGEVHLGGYVSLPVLLNDFDPNGIALSVTAVEIDEKVTDPRGSVFVQGNQIRYVAPSVSATPGPFTVTGTYTVSNGRDQVNGRFTIQVTDPAQNRPPSPAPVELRTFEEYAVTYWLPSYGLDPDGDPVELVAVEGAGAVHGTVELMDGGAGFTYTPLPGQSGSDSFRWQLRDSYDAVGYLDIHVVIAPRAVNNHPPVAVRDTAQVILGESVFIPVLANDTDSDPGDVVVFADPAYGQPNSGAGEVPGVTEDGFVEYIAPETEGEYSFLYFITDRQSPPVQGLVTVTVTTADKIVNRPPVVRDVVLPPAAAGQQVMVDLKEYATDPEGQPLAFSPGPDAAALGAVVAGSVLTVTMTPEPMIFTFVADDGAPNNFSGIGVVQIPAPKNRAPVAQVLNIEVAEDEAIKRIDIPSDTFSDPDGDPVSIYTGSQPTIVPAEASNGGDLKWDGNGFVFNRNPEFGGTAQIQYYIVDTPATGEAITVPASIVLTILRDINQPPVVASGTTEVISGTSSQFDLGALVRDPDPEDEANLTISDVAWSGPAGVTMTSAGGVLTFTAEIDAAKEGESLSGTVSFTVDDHREAGQVQGTLAVTVKPTSLGEPLAVDDLVDDVLQGESPTWNLLGNDPPNGTGQGTQSDYVIVEVTQPSLGVVTIVGTDSVKFTPTPELSGQTTFTYTIEDRALRRSTATVRFAVLDRPATPEQPTVGEQLSTTAVVSFARPDDHGSPIDSFEVKGVPGGAATCVGSPCTVDSLINGEEYTFQVRAHNGVGWSEWSPSSEPYTPDELPGTPPAPTADWDDHSAIVTWGAIPNDGSDIIDVSVSVSPADAAPIVFSGGEGGGSVTFPTLDNGTPYTFSIVARNKKGDSPRSASSASVTPVGPPSFPSAPTLVAWNGFVDISWPTADGNGDNDLTYTIKLTDETAGSTIANNAGAALSRQLPAVNGHVYRAIITVQNAYTARYDVDGVDSSASGSDKAIGPPAAPGSVTATAGAGNGAISLSWGAADPNGGTISGYEVSTNGGAWTSVGNTTSTTFSSGLTLGSNYTFQVRALNDNRAGEPGASSAASNASSPYTPPAQPSASCANSGTTINCSWSVGALNGPTPQTVAISGAFTSTQPSGSWSSGNIGYSQSRSFTIQVCNAGTASNNCNSNSAGASTPPPPPPPPPTVSISWNGSAQGQPGCSSPACKWVSVSIANFSGGNHTFACHGSNDGYQVFYSRVSGSTTISQLCYYGFAGQSLYVTVDGVRSNIISV